MFENTTTMPLSMLCRISMLWLFFSASSLIAQDIHFSQYGNSPLNLSPGLAGVFGGDLRFVGNYRQQWRTIPVPYTTFSGSVESKVYLKHRKYNKFITTSLLINHDQQGDLELKSLQIGIPFAVTFPLSKSNFLTIGATPMFGQRSFNTDNITFDEQYTGGMYDPSAAITENLSLTSLKYFDLSAGVNLRLQERHKRSRVDIGAAMHHINRPAHDFWASSVTNKEEVRLYNKLTIYSLGMLQLTDNFDLLVQGLYQKQGGDQEIVYGWGVRMHLSKNKYKELSLQIGADWRHRFSNSFVPHAELFYRTWTLGASFDWDAFSRAGDLVTRQRGGPELSLIYRLYKIKPLDKFRSCPII
jgi:type IX secretion system PorP/SprF family membrane protein